jgi:hypothetical protein
MDWDYHWRPPKCLIFGFVLLRIMHKYGEMKSLGADWSNNYGKWED